MLLFSGLLLVENFLAHFAASTLASFTRTTEAGAVGEFNGPDIVRDTAAELAAQGIEGNTVHGFVASQRSDHIVEERPPCSRTNVAAVTSVFRRGITESSTIEDNDPVIGSNSKGNLNSRVITDGTVSDIVAPHVMESVSEEPTASGTLATDPDRVVQTSPHARDSDLSDLEDEAGEVEHPLILTGDREIPFTYMACLFAKWTMQKDHISSIQGKIKVIFMV